MTTTTATNLMNDGEPNYDVIAAALRQCIEQQVATSSTGQGLAALDAALLARFVTNVVGNLTYTVAGLVEDAVAEKTPA